MPAEIRPVYARYLDVLVKIDRHQTKRDFTSPAYKKLREELDSLYEQLLPQEHEDVLRFSLALDLESRDEPSEDAGLDRGAVSSDRDDEAAASEDSEGTET